MGRTFKEILESILPLNKMIFFGTDMYQKFVNLVHGIKDGYEKKDTALLTKHLSSENIEETESFEEFDKLVKASYDDLEEMDNIHKIIDTMNKKLEEAEDILR